MIRYCSSVHKSDWECSSKSVRGSFFVNPLYIKNLTNLTNLTILQILQPYRFLCRVPKGPHVYLCTLHKGRPSAPCSAHNLCSLLENRGLPRRCKPTIQGPLRCIPARLQFGGLRARTHGQRFDMEGGRPAYVHTWVQLFISASCIPARLHHTDLFCFGVKLGNFPKCGRSASNLHGSRPVRDMEWKPCEPSKIKRTHRSRSFWLPRRRSQNNFRT